MDYLLYVDDCLIRGMMQVFLDLRCSRIYWMMIMHLDFIICYLSKVAHRVMIKYNLRCSKVIEWPTKDFPLLIKGEYTYGLLSRSLSRNLQPKWKCHEECLQVHN